MQGQMQRPTAHGHIAHEGTPNELWWDSSTEQWVKPPPRSTSVDISKVVQVLTAIRDARAARRKAYEKKDLEMAADEQQIRAVLLQLLNETGARSIATDFGTVYRSEKIKPSAADWSAIYSWIGEDPERFELLEKRLKPTFVKQFMEEHEGNIPPGINVHREFEVSVRRAAPTT